MAMMYSIEVGVKKWPSLKLLNYNTMFTGLKLIAEKALERQNPEWFTRVVNLLLDTWT